MQHKWSLLFQSIAQWISNPETLPFAFSHGRVRVPTPLMIFLLEFLKARDTIPSGLRVFDVGHKRRVLMFCPQCIVQTQVALIIVPHPCHTSLSRTAFFVHCIQNMVKSILVCILPSVPEASEFILECFQCVLPLILLLILLLDAFFESCQDQHCLRNDACGLIGRGGCIRVC